MSYRLVIARHGEVPDDTDYLTSLGLSQAFHVADELFYAQLNPKTILYSPLCRTFQTANGLKDAFDRKGVRDITLSPAEWLRDRAAPEMVRELGNLSDGTVVVTHYREMMELASYWGIERKPGFGEAWILKADSASDFNAPGMPEITIVSNYG